MIRARRAPGTLEICGHAETAPAGQDLVCAAVSILADTLASLLPAEKASMGKGLARFSFSEPCPPADFVTHGLSLLAAYAPEAVTVEKYNKNEN